jgi:NitT/TauT family transport system substrate-binding protein
MRKRHLSTLVLALGLLFFLAAGCGGEDEPAAEEPAETGGEAAEPVEHPPIRLAFSTWNGYTGLVVGVESGMFEEEGLEVTYEVIEDPVQRFNAVEAGSLDAIATTPDTFSRTYARGIETVQVLGLDASVGGDGIVAEREIDSVEALEGQTVAVSEGSTSQWLLAYVLDQNGLTLDAVEQVNLTSSDAGAAFAAGRGPVAVTWEPWLTRAQQNPNGHILVSTEDHPEIITDTVAFTPSFIEENPETVKAFIRAYGQVMDFIESNPDEAFEFATDYLGQTVDEIETGTETVPLWNLEQSAEYFGTVDEPGAVYDIFTQSGEFWQSIGEIEEVAPAEPAINPTFLNEVLAEQ